MSIDISTSARMYRDIHKHTGHKLECVSYGNGVNVAIECVTCGCVLLDADLPMVDMDRFEQAVDSLMGGPEA